MVLETSSYYPKEVASLFIRYDHLLPKSNPGQRDKAPFTAPLGGGGEERYKLNDPSPNSSSDHTILSMWRLVRRDYDNPLESRFSNFAPFWNHLEDIEKYWVLGPASGDSDLISLGCDWCVRSLLKLLRLTVTCCQD